MVSKEKLEISEKTDQKKFLIRVRVSETEYQMIQANMKRVNMKNLSEYARRMMLYGFCLREDFEPIAQLARQFSGIAANINQIARRLNEMGDFYTEDMQELASYVFYIKSKLNEQLLKIANRKFDSRIVDMAFTQPDEEKFLQAIEKLAEKGNNGVH